MEAWEQLKIEVESGGADWFEIYLFMSAPRRLQTLSNAGLRTIHIRVVPEKRTFRVTLILNRHLRFLKKKQIYNYRCVPKPSAKKGVRIKMITHPGVSDFCLITKSSGSAPRANNSDPQTKVGKGEETSACAFSPSVVSVRQRGWSQREQGHVKISVCREFLCASSKLTGSRTD